MSASDAVILFVADGVVAVGRVLGRFRRPCVAEKRAQAHVDALNALEDSQDGLEPGQLTDAQQAAVDLGLSLADRAVTYGDQICAAYVDAFKPPADFASPECSAAVSPPAADNTPDVDHLEAAWNYHTGAVGYAAMRAGGVEWFCEGCNWHGPTKQAHARHRFQVLADMKNATTRVQEQLGGTA